MSITASTKIFVDVDDEINFIVEKVLAADQERVIVVVPQNALLISSLVSMRILAQQIFKSKKNVVIVSEDDFGIKIAKESGLVAVKKVSEVTPKLWEEAQLKKVEAQDKMEERKRELLQKRGISVGGTEEAKAELTEADYSTSMTSETSGEEETAEDEIKSTEEPASVPTSETTAMSTPTQAETETAEDVTTTEQEPEEEITGAIQRPRRDPKLVTVGSFQVYAGGDITEIDKDAIVNSPETASESQTTMETDESSSREVPTQQRKPNFTSRDWSSMTSTKKQGNFLTRLLPKRKARNTQQDKPKRRLFTNSRSWLIGFVLLLVFAGIVGYLLLFRFTSVDLRVTLETQEVPVEQQVSASTEVSEVNTESEDLVLPAELIEDDTLSISASETATGTGIKGDKAAGVIEIWNKTQDPVELSEGTLLTDLTTDRKYILQENVTLEAASEDVESGDTYGGFDKELRIEAEKVGEEYNIPLGSDSSQEFKVEGYSTEDLIGRRFRGIEGGTSQEFTAVSEEDVKKVKEPLVEKLKERGTERLRNLVTSERRLLEETVKFEETETTVSPKVGEEADTFSVSVEGKVTAFTIGKQELDEVITEIIKRTDDIDEDLQISNVDDAALKDVSRKDNTVSFTITSKGSLQRNITEEGLATELTGKKYVDARAYLDQLEDIKQYRLNFSPAFIPEELQFLPQSSERIQVRIDS